MQQKLDFKKARWQLIQLHVASILITTSYITKASNVAVFSKHLAQLTSLKSEVNKLKDEVVAMDQGLFDKSGRRLSPGKSIHHDV